MKSILKKGISISMFLILYVVLSVYLDRLYQYTESNYVSEIYPELMKIAILFFLSIIFGIVIFIWIKCSQRLRVVFLELLFLLVVLSAAPYVSLLIIHNLVLTSVLSQCKELSITLSGLMMLGVFVSSKISIHS